MKSLCILTIILSTTIAALAQNKTHWQPYVRAGVGASRAIGEAATSTVSLLLSTNSSGQPMVIPEQLGGSRWVVTGSVGAGVMIPISSVFSLQAEVNVDQKGTAMNIARYAYDGTICDPGPCIFSPFNGQFSSRLTYLTLPVLGSYRFGKVNLSAGPYVGYKLIDKQQGTYALPGRVETYSLNNSGREYANWDMGFAAGLTYALTSVVSLDLRYSQGLRSLAVPYSRFGYGGYKEKSYYQSTQFALRYNLLH